MATISQSAKANLPGQHSVLEGIWPGNCCLCTHETTIEKMQIEIDGLVNSLELLTDDEFDHLAHLDPEASRGVVPTKIGQPAQHFEDLLSVTEVTGQMERLQRVAKAADLLQLSTAELLYGATSMRDMRRKVTVHDFNVYQLGIHLQELEAGDLGDYD